MTPVHLGDGLAYVRIPRTLAGIHPACPRCPWVGPRGIAAGTYRWRQWLALDIANHPCSNPPDQEKP